jgi:acetyl esterase/lipase
MDLKAIQAPLKRTYRADPSQAMVVLHATGEIDVANVRAEGDWDARGTLGVSRDAAVGFSAIRLEFAFDSSASDAELERLSSLSERYCVVLQTLARPPALSVSVRRLVWYTSGLDRRLPLISPLFAELGNLPPILLQVGSDEMRLSDSLRLAEAVQRCGGRAELEVWDGMWHNWPMWAQLPEADAALRKIGQFLDDR